MNNIKAQSTSVVNAVFKVLNIESSAAAIELTKEQFAQVCDIVSESIWSGNTFMSERAREKYNTLELIRKKYAGGLVNNHLRKHKALNGGIQHVPAIAKYVLPRQLELALDEANGQIDIDQAV